jgi:trimethylamine-N-oxide reductase (cytochrome c)
LGTTGAAQYPLHLISPHPKFRLHSQMNNTWLRGAYEVARREPIWINPDDAKTRNIADGDVVRVFNGRGQVLAGAILTNRIRPGVVVLEEGAWYDPDKPGEVGAMCRHRNINVLTLDKGTSKLAQGNVANTLLVQIERYSGMPRAVRVFAAPAQR